MSSMRVSGCHLVKRFSKWPRMTSRLCHSSGARRLGESSRNRANACSTHTPCSRHGLKISISGDQSPMFSSAERVVYEIVAVVCPKRGAEAQLFPAACDARR